MIPQTTAQLITEAEKMLRVNSPRMAMLYMTRASEKLEQARIDRMSPEERAVYLLGRNLQGMVDGLTPIFMQLAATANEASRTIWDALQKVLPPETASKYTLAN